ncbi:MAG: hypothetical protein GXO75_03965 [Calditrichaeota bacterium]|nr:hypothetical protein [Calditrichota bacterium]
MSAMRKNEFGNVSSKWFLAALLILAAALRIYHLAFKSISIDESIGFFYALDTLPHVIAFTINDVHPPLFYILHHFWIALFGTGEAAIRSISVFWGLLSIWGIYKLGSLLFNRTVGLLAAFLLTISPWHIWLCQNARSNAMLMFLAIANIYFFYRIITTTQKKWYYLYGIITLTAIYTHYFAFMLWIAEGLYVLISRFMREKISFLFWQINLGILIGYGLWLPFMISQFITKTRPMYKELSPHFFKDLFDIMNPYVADPKSWIFFSGEILLLALLVLGIVLLYKSKPKTENIESRIYETDKDRDQTALNRLLKVTPIILFIGSLFAAIYFTMPRSLHILADYINNVNKQIYANHIRPYHIVQLRSFHISFLLSADFMLLLFVFQIKLYPLLNFCHKMLDKAAGLFRISKPISFSKFNFIAVLILVPPLIAGLLSLKSPYLLLRNMVIIFPLYLVIIAFAIYSIRNLFLRQFVLLCILAFASLSFIHFEEWNIKDDWRSAARTTKMEMHKGDIILLDHLFGKKPFYYYGLDTHIPLRRDHAEDFLKTVHNDIWFLVSYAGKWSAEGLLNRTFIKVREWDFPGTTNPDDWHPKDDKIRLIHYRYPGTTASTEKQLTLEEGGGQRK